jgi:hypothetical protein
VFVILSIVVLFNGGFMEFFINLVSKPGKIENWFKRAHYGIELRSKTAFTCIDDDAMYPRGIL